MNFSFLKFFYDFFWGKFFSRIFSPQIFLGGIFLGNLVCKFFLEICFGIFFGNLFFNFFMRGPEWPEMFLNDLWDVWSKNLTNAGSRMTFGMFGPKTLPTRGSERPFRSLDMVNLGKLIISVAVVRHVYKVTIIIWSGKTFF